MSSIEFSFENPWYLLLAIPSYAVILIPFFLLPARRRQNIRKILPVVLHMIIVSLLVLIIAGFTVVSNSHEQAVVLVVDLSDSTDTVQDQIEYRTRELLELIEENTPVGIVAFGQNRVYTVSLEEQDQLTLSMVETDATDIGAALEYAASRLPADRAGHLILLSDGKQTDGDALSMAQYLATKGIRIDAVYFDTTNLETEEVQIAGFALPEGAYVGDTVELAVDIRSNTTVEVALTLFDGNTQVGTVNHTVQPGSNVVALECTVETAGTHELKLVLGSQADTIIENNITYGYLPVAGESSVLIISDTIGNGEVLAEVLEESNTVTIVTARNAPKSIIELCNYDEIILSNVDYDLLPAGYDELLETYVSVFGRSLLVVGGENTMMYGSMRGTVLEEMLPVTLRLQENSEGKSVAMMLVLDCSSSMSQQSTYLSVAKQGAIKCVEAMTENDFVGVISFNSTAYLKSSLIVADEDNKASLSRIISALTTNRGTYYTEALKLAHEELLKSDAPVRHIMFLSDGQPNDNGYAEAVRAAAADGITVSTIGLGYSSDILATLAEYGDGRYYYVSNASELPNIMLSETEQVTVSSLITGEFIPVVAVESDLTAGVAGETLPAIYGYLGTTLKEEATAYLVTQEEHPIYASWNYGLGTVACFTCDLNGTWSSQWLSEEAGKLLTRAMVDTTVDDVHHDSSMSAEITVRGQTTEITVATAGTTEDVLTLTAASDSGSKNYTLNRLDSGVYTATVSTEDPGVYSLMITQTNEEGQIVDHLETAVAVGYSDEYDAFAESGEGLLLALVGETGGDLFTDMEQVAAVKVNSISQVFNPLILFAAVSAALLLADIAIRKLRWKDVLYFFGWRKKK